MLRGEKSWLMGASGEGRGTVAMPVAVAIKARPFRLFTWLAENSRAWRVDARHKSVKLIRGSHQCFVSLSPSPSPAVPSVPTSPTNFTDVFAQARPVAVPVAVEAPAEAVDLQDAVKKSEHQVISAALQNTDSRLEAAKLLGISPRTLRYKMAQLRERGVNVNMTPTSMRA